MAILAFQKFVSLDSFPDDWELSAVAVDWSGCPLLLMLERRGPKPELTADDEVWRQWNNAKSKALHVVYFEGSSLRTTCVQRGGEIFGGPIQPIGDGWIAGGGRGGRVNVCDSSGSFVDSLNVGEGYADLQTQPDGRIWVSYSDQGVYGANGISNEGLACFNRTGEPLFRFFTDVAKPSRLPVIDDCYALNAASNGDVWVNYYSDFPLVLLREMRLSEHWPKFGSLGDAFAVRDDGLYYHRDSKLFFKSFDAMSAQETVDCVDENGNALAPASSRYVPRVAARGADLVLNTGTAIYSTAGYPRSRS